MKLTNVVLVLVAAAAISAVMPASARHLKHHRAYAPEYGAQGWASPGLQGRDPYGAYVDTHKVGRDPDPNVRRQLQNDYGFMWGW